MFARLCAALVGLLSCAPCFGSPDLVSPAKHAVVVYLRINTGQRAEPVREMEREASSLLASAGYQLDWRDLSLGSSEAVPADIVVVELRGICEPPRRPDLIAPLATPSSLASTAISNGEILPFTWVECETLSRFLAAPLTKAESKQDYLYGRAMGRVIAHELYHILTKTRDHDTDGVAKSRFSASDVLAEHFAFDTLTLARLREPSEATSDLSEDLEESSR